MKWWVQSSEEKLHSVLTVMWGRGSEEVSPPVLRSDRSASLSFTKFRPTDCSCLIWTQRLSEFNQQECLSSVGTSTTVLLMFGLCRILSMLSTWWDLLLFIYCWTKQLQTCSSYWIIIIESYFQSFTCFSFSYVQ